MALIVNDRVKETTTTTGTGAVTLGCAQTNFVTFSSVLSDADTTYYAIVDNDNLDFEVGLGTYASTGNTLTRTTVFSSSNAGALVNFGAGQKDVFMTYPAEKAVYFDASGDLEVTTINGLELGLGNTGGDTSVSVGRDALGSSLSDGDFNTAVGDQALTNLTTGDNNVAIGQKALEGLTTGDSSTAVGTESAQKNNADYTTAVGFRALEENTTGEDNTAVGAFALEDNQTGDRNTAIGYSALEEMIDQNDNTAVGFRALEQCQDGSQNTGVGSGALDTTTSGTRNTSVGYQSMTANTTGIDNVAVGASAMGVNVSGSENTAVGASAMTNMTSGSNNTAIGYDAEPSGGSVSNEVTVGNTSVDKFRVPGVNFVIDNGSVGINGDAPSTEVEIHKDRNPVLTLTSTLNDSGYLNQSYGTISFASDDVSGPGAGDARATISAVSTTSTGAAGALAFSTTTGGSGEQVSERMRLTHQGRLGLGTTTPSTSFHISQSSAIVRVQDSDGTNQYIEMVHSAGGSQFRARNNTNNGTIQFAGLNGTATTEYGRFTAQGRFGVGTTAPAYPIELKAASGATIINVKAPTTTDQSHVFFSDTSNGVGRLTYDHSIDAMVFHVNGAERARITDAGNVGIGTASVNAVASYRTLEINGGTDVGGAIRLSSDGTEEYALAFNFNGNAYYGGSTQTVLGTVTNDSFTKGYILSKTQHIWYDPSDGVAEFMRIAANGNLGIGDSSPTYKTVIAGTTSLAIDTEGLLSDASTTTVGVTAGGQSLNLRGSGSGEIKFSIGSSEKMRVASSGNVGIGTNTPAQALEVAASVPRVRITDNNTPAATSTSFLEFQGSDARAGVIYTDSNGFNVQADGAGAGPIRFLTNGSNERARVDATGNFLVGKASAGFAVAGCRIQQTGDVRISKAGAASDTMVGFYKNGSATAVGTITSTSTATAYNTSSDERLKENIVDAPAGNIDALQVRSFDWKVNGEHQEYGFIAQELEIVAPYAVTPGETDEKTGEEGMKSVDYSKLVPMLVKEIQDLKAEVAALKGA